MKTKWTKKFGGAFVAVARLRGLELVVEWDPRVPRAGEISMDVYEHWRDTTVVPGVMAALNKRTSLVIG